MQLIYPVVQPPVETSELKVKAIRAIYARNVKVNNFQTYLS